MPGTRRDSGLSRPPDSYRSTCCSSAADSDRLLPRRRPLASRVTKPGYRYFRYASRIAPKSENRPAGDLARRDLSFDDHRHGRGRYSGIDDFRFAVGGPQEQQSWCRSHVGDEAELVSSLVKSCSDHSDAVVLRNNWRQSPTAATAARIASIVAWGCDTIETCEPATSVIVALARSAMLR